MPEPQQADPDFRFPIDDTNRPIADRFRQIARRFPERPAIREEASTFTYAEVDRWTDALAAAIRLRCGDRKRHVAFLFPHDARAILGLIGVAKSGHVYVPLDPAWPDPRLNELLGDVEAAAVLTDVAGAARLRTFSGWRGEILELEDALACPAGHAPDPFGSPDDAACIYYSSGSTGKPKGIVLGHATVLSAARNYRNALGITPEDRIAWVSPVSFGASKMPIFAGLLSGACVLPFPVKVRGLSELATWMQRQRITIYPSATSLLRELLSTLPDGPNLPDLRAVKVGGEPVVRADLALFRRKLHSACILLNGLGITETAANVCFYRWDGRDVPETPQVPLGYAAEGMEILILDDAQRPLPPGEVGEVAIRSHHLASQYWRLPELTRTRFLPPADDTGRRTFLTGDLGRIDTDGCLIGIGRKDHMLKIRGHRVETAEVEAALLALPGVSQAAVAGRDEGGKTRLFAFVVPGQGHRPSPASLRRALRGRIPDYMIPARIVLFDSLPKLSTGKVDRGALASLDLEPDPVRERVSPRDTLEHELVLIWERALRRGDIGITDDFFELGGDSLDAVRIFALMERWLRVNLPIVTLAERPTIESLAGAVRAGSPRVASSSAVLLNAGEGGLPFFCVPGAGSDVFALLDLARHLDTAQTFYGLQHAGADGKRPSFTSVERMAARFLEDVRMVQPTGPYCLGGTSFGGVVAWEMARQLKSAGERVALLALIEAFGPGYPTARRRARWRHPLELALRSLLPVGRKDDHSRGNLGAGLREKLLRLRATLDLSLPFRRKSPPYELRFLYLQQVCFRACYTYRFPPYDGPVVLFRAEQQPPAHLYERRDDLGWGESARGCLEIHEIPGVHGAHIREPHVRTLAAKLQAKLEKASRRDPGVFDELGPRTREIWNELAPWWDERTGETGNPDSREAIVPEMDALLGIQPGERVLDVACGNGWFSRRLARAGAAVVGFDFSEELLGRAHERTAALGMEINFHLLDATKPADLARLQDRSFDAALCNMGLQDMANVEPLFSSLSCVLRPGGRFVFSIVHPGAGKLAEASVEEPLTNIGTPGQPVPSYYFHRPLPLLLDLATRNGFVLEESREIHSPGGSGASSVAGSFLLGRLRLVAGH